VSTSAVEVSLPVSVPVASCRGVTRVDPLGAFPWGVLPCGVLPLGALPVVLEAGGIVAAAVVLLVALRSVVVVGTIVLVASFFLLLLQLYCWFWLWLPVVSRLFEVRGVGDCTGLSILISKAI